MFLMQLIVVRRGPICNQNGDPVQDGEHGAAAVASTFIQSP